MAISPTPPGSQKRKIIIFSGMKPPFIYVPIPSLNPPIPTTKP